MKKIICVCFLIIALGTTSFVQGGTKEEIVRLQSDVLALQNQIRNLDKTFTDQMGSLKSLVGQLNDQLGKSNVILARISTTLENQADNSKTANQGVLQEVRSLAHKIDDTGTRVSALAQQISEIKVQSAPITQPQRRFQAVGTGPNSAAASADDVFHEAYNDLVQGNYDLATQGFTSFVNNFPRSEKSDDALYYLGETYYNDNKFPLAITAFTRVLSDYPTGDKVASALYKRALAELRIQEKDTARDDFRAVVQRFPASPEAGLARTQLEALGDDPAKPKFGPIRRKP